MRQVLAMTAYKVQVHFLFKIILVSIVINTNTLELNLQVLHNFILSVYYSEYSGIPKTKPKSLVSIKFYYSTQVSSIYMIMYQIKLTNLMSY